jgi:hypothetical protein
MNCPDLYHGKDLDLLAKRVAPRHARTYRQDNKPARKNSVVASSVPVALQDLTLALAGAM